MRLSIIIPAYNAARYIERCLESVHDQNFDDYEVIVINDGSTDDTLALLQKFKKKDSRLNILTQENRGVSAARNRGIEMAQGEYVMFVDADDSLYLGCLNKIFDRIADGVDLVLAGMTSVSRNGEHGIVAKYGDKKMADCCPIDFFWGLSELQFGLPTGKLYRTALLKDGSVRFDEEMALYEDSIFNIEFASRCRLVQTVDVDCYVYGRYMGGASAKFYGEQLPVFNERLRSARMEFFGCADGNFPERAARINRGLAFDYLFGIYSIYRSKGCRNKYRWLKAYWSAADEHDPRWSYQLDSGVPKTVGIVGRRSKRLLDWWLRGIFMVEQIKRRFSNLMI